MGADRLGLESWAAKRIRVPDGPRAGRPYRVIREPWRQILRDLISRQLEQVTIRASVQSGKTAALIVAALYHMAHKRSVIFYEPDEALQRMIAERITLWGLHSTDGKLIDAFSPARRPFVRVHEDGGRLEILNASAKGAGLSRTADVVIVDELRAFNADVLQTLIDRMAAFGGRGLLITASSAGYEGDCKTTAELEKSDRRQWFMSCECGAENIASWEAFRLGKGAAPAYVMPCCGLVLDTAGLAAVVKRGRWKATGRAPVPRTRGYHLDCFSGSAFETLETIDRTWTRAAAHRKQTGSLAEIVDFQCGRLALPFSPITQAGVTPELIQSNCREDYDPAIVPLWASIVVCAVDVQDNRLEAELSAWGAVEVETEDSATELKGWDAAEFRGLRHNGRWYRLRRAALSYHRLRGDPGAAQVWEDLAELSETLIPHASGVLIRPAVTGIDVGGHYGPQVSEFVKARGSGYVCLKGLSVNRHAGQLARMSITANSLDEYGPAGLMLVCGNSAKATIFSLLRQGIAGDRPLPLMWPMDEAAYGPQEFEGVCSEALERSIDRRTGRTRTLWRKTRRDNEALDILCYSLALASYWGVGFMLANADDIDAAAKSQRKAA